MRSWVGLLKTLHIITPNISTILAPFKVATAGKDSKKSLEWTHELEQRFREAKNATADMKILYLPSPDDQLILVPDAVSERWKKWRRPCWHRSYIVCNKG